MKKVYVVPEISFAIANFEPVFMVGSKGVGNAGDDVYSRRRDGIDPMDSPSSDNSKQQKGGWGSLW